SVASGGNPGGSAISSGFGQLTFTPAVASCGGANGIMLGIIGAGSTQSTTCSWDIGYHDYGVQATTGNPTVTANLEQAGDLVIAAGFVVNGYTSTATNIAGTDNMTHEFSGTSSSDTGQVFIDAMLGNTVTGASQTITTVITGAHTAAQVGYIEMVPSAKCTMSFDVASSVGTGSGAVANTPSITGTAGDL